MAKNYEKGRSSNFIKQMSTMNSQVNAKVINEIDMSLIDENPDNREIFNMEGIERLKDTIEEVGFTGAIEVFEKPDGRYEISSGHRRFLAMKQLNKASIPCIVLPYVEDTERAKKLITSNVNNRVMTPLDYANIIEYYKKSVYNPKKQSGSVRTEISKLLGISESQVHRFTAIKKMIPELQQMAMDPVFPFTAFTSAITLSSEDQKLLFDEITKYKAEQPEFEISRTRIENMIRTIKELREREQKRIHNETAETKKGAPPALVFKELEKSKVCDYELKDPEDKANAKVQKAQTLPPKEPGVEEPVVEEPLVEVKTPENEKKEEELNNSSINSPEPAEEWESEQKKDEHSTKESMEAIDPEQTGVEDFYNTDNNSFPEMNAKYLEDIIAPLEEQIINLDMLKYPVRDKAKLIKILDSITVVCADLKRKTE